ncbi:hypothetical protein CRI93_02525 [Longimonas halophila]|uniref:Histidine kinase n=1 Tax=Longimonas halophila TaxID=1469170 RepID=A0A2H3NXF9_9BACT|nr:PAS domain-containing protein [Longimonas halophila]PEN09624.1 hypothetical protein CRI93_02525 [Longimonas halophila]
MKRNDTRASSHHSNSNEEALSTSGQEHADPSAASAARSGAAPLSAPAYQQGTDLRELVNRLPGAVYRCTYDTAWTSIYMGEGFKQICGLDPQDLDPAGRSFKEVVVPEDLDRIRRAVATAVQDHTYYRVEYRIQSDSGAIRWVQDNGRPSFKENGAVRWLDGILLDVTERKRAQEELMQAEAQAEAQVEARTTKLRELSAALTMAEQRERSQIASAVHDNLLQYLYGIQVQLRMLIDGMHEASEVDMSTLPVSPSQVDDLMDEAIDATRKLTLDLAPPVLDNDGIIEALQWLRSHLKKQHGFVVHLDDKTNGVSCTGEARTVLFRVARELLLNTCKYADVESADVHVYTEDQTFHLDVVDDGTGFDPSTALQRGTNGSGLWKARERLRSIDGTLRVTAAPGEGTCCAIQVPVDALDPESPDAASPSVSR